MSYLKTELYELIKQDSTVFDFIQNSALDGLWYWDLGNPTFMNRTKEHPNLEHLSKPMTMDRIRELCNRVINKEFANKKG